MFASAGVQMKKENRFDDLISDSEDQEKITLKNVCNKRVLLKHSC